MKESGTSYPGVSRHIEEISVDLEYIDIIPMVRKFVLNFKKNEHFMLQELGATDIIRLHPISAILEHRVEELYGHPLINAYIRHKFRLHKFTLVIVLNLIIYLLFVVFLNLYAFSMETPWQIIDHQLLNLVVK